MNFLNGLVYPLLLELSFIILGIANWGFEVDHLTVRLHTGPIIYCCQWLIDLLNLCMKMQFDTKPYIFYLLSLFYYVWSCKLHTLKSIPGTNQFWAIKVKFLAQGNNGLPLTGFEPMQLVILRLLVQRVNHLTTPPPFSCIDISN